MMLLFFDCGTYKNSAINSMKILNETLLARSDLSQVLIYSIRMYWHSTSFGQQQQKGSNAMNH